MGEKRASWIQVMSIGEVGLVAIPGDPFSGVGMRIKNRSPFRHTLVIAGANGWMGLLPDEEAFQLGGFETLMGNHGFAERDVTSQVVDQAVDMLLELSQQRSN